ncbi:MAG: mechanosensitive ion channel family protein [Desulfobacterales bacterium]|nr:mechanosensitive ion channel family protein [Desulfobacterales bacterium]
MEITTESIDRLLGWLRGLPGSDTAFGLAAYKSLAVLAVTFLAWYVLKAMLLILDRRLQKFPFFQNNPQTIHSFRRIVFYALVAIALTYATRLFGLNVLETVFQALLIILAAGPIKDVLIVVLTYLEQRLAARTNTKVDDIIFDLLNRFSGAILYVTAVILALDVVGINVMPFIAGAGVAGIAIGFAAKDTLSNLIAGVLLIIDRPFEVGDRIEVWSAPKGSASWGDVVDIGLRATRIKTTDNIVIIIPNNEIMKRDIVNYTSITAQIRVRVNIGIAYEADIHKAKTIIVEVARRMDWAAVTPAPKVVVRNFGDSSVDLQLRVWIKEARRRMDTISFVIDQVKEAFDQAGIEIPYPKRDIQITPSMEPPSASGAAG